MHCLEISLIEVKIIIIIIIKNRPQQLWLLARLVDGAILLYSVASGTGPRQHGCLLTLSPRGGKRSLLFTLGAAFKVPPFHGLFCSLKKECLCPWAPGRVSPLFGHGFGVLVCFHSFGVRGGVSTGWEILILKQLEPSLLPFLSPSLKTKEYSPNL